MFVLNDEDKFINEYFLDYVLNIIPQIQSLYCL